LISALSRPILTAIPWADADDPAIAPFTSAFMRMMFAHAEFEARAHEVRMLAGDNSQDLWTNHKRPKLTCKEIRKRFGEIPEIADVASVEAQPRNQHDNRKH